MELLQSYGDAISGESSVEGDESGDGEAKELSEFPNGSCENNFFHLGSDFGNVGKSREEEHMGSYHGDRTVLFDMLGNSHVEVPESPFWNEFSTEDLKQARLRDCQKAPPGFKPKYCETIGRQDTSHATTDTFNTTSRKHGDNIGEPSSKVMKHSNSSVCAFENRSRNIDLQRKIFYIHSRIKPGVHTQCRNRPATKEERDVGAHCGVANRIKWNVANFSHLLLSASMDSSVCVWNAWSDGDPCVRKLKHHLKAVKDAEWSRDGRNILSCSYDRTAILSDVETGKQLCKLEHTSYVTCGKFHPARSSQVVTGSTNCVQHWDVRTPHTACRDFHHKDDMGQIQDVLFSRDGNQMFTCSDTVTRDSADRNIIAWDYSSGVILSNQIYQERYACVRLKLHPTSGHFLAQTHGGYIALFSSNRPYKMSRSKRFEGHTLQGYSIGFDVSRDGSLVYSASSDGILRCYDFHSGKLRQTVETGQGVCMDVSCHPVLSSTLASCSWDGNIKVFQ